MKDGMNRIRVIFFDAGSVLFTTKVKLKHRIRNVLHSLGYKEEEQAQAITAAQAVLDEFSVSGKWLSNWEQELTLWQEYYDALLRSIGIKDNSLKDELFHLCHYVQHCVTYPDVLPTLKRLRRYYRLGVITNAYPSMDCVFDRLKLRRFFDQITISAYVGYAKPEPQIYLQALEAMKCKPHQAFFIDNKPDNVAGAKKVGIDGVTLCRDAPTQSQNIRALSELDEEISKIE